MIKTSLAEAKAHLSELVDQAEHKKKRIMIMRHGKPAAPIAAQSGDSTFPAVDDLIRSGR